MSGTCALKIDAPTISSSADLFVSNKQSDIDSSEDRTGALDKPFVDLLDAVVRAKELAAPYRGLRVNIHLYRGKFHILLIAEGTHYVLRGNAGFYQPQVYRDDENTDFELVIQYATHLAALTINPRPLLCSFSGNGGISISDVCAESTEKVTVYNKRAQFFYIEVPSRLEIKNHIFNSLDSLLPCTHRNLNAFVDYNSDAMACLNERSPCCQISSSGELQNTSPRTF